MPKIFEPREKLVPAEYPEFHEAWRKAVHSPWHHEEVQMSSDILDWNSDRLNEKEKKAIAGMLLGFTLLEQRIGCYWRNTVANVFPKPEIIGMATAFAHQEVIHQNAYNHLENTLGLDTYDAFVESDSAQEKMAQYEPKKIVAPYESLDRSDYEWIISETLKELAVFSGAGEGLSLFGSFAILLNFCRRGVLKGTRQILSWSILEERIHAENAIKLFKTVTSEYPELKPKFEYVEEAFENRVQCELDFIQNAFDTGGITDMTMEDIEKFLYHRKYKILGKLGYDVSSFPQYENSINAWFYPLIEQSTEHDFFTASRNGTSYAATITQDFKGVDYDSLRFA